MELAHRRLVGRVIRIGLIGVAIAIAISWIVRRAPVPRDLRVQSEAPTVEALGPGDLRIYSRDSSVNLILQGDNILAGLSPKTIAKVRAELEASGADDDTTGLGGSIAQMVKKTVADKIGTHVVFPLSEIREIRYDGDEIVIERHGRGDTRLFDNTKVNGQPLSKSFRREDAERFVEAVRARKNARP
ncbi:MAG: hypothetical protein WD825_01840 [Gemmatimonadaceae bacterium]